MRSARFTDSSTPKINWEPRFQCPSFLMNLYFPQSKALLPWEVQKIVRLLTNEEQPQAGIFWREILAREHNLIKRAPFWIQNRKRLGERQKGVPGLKRSKWERERMVYIM